MSTIVMAHLFSASQLEASCMADRKRVRDEKKNVYGRLKKSPTIFHHRKFKRARRESPPPFLPVPHHRGWGGWKNSKKLFSCYREHDQGGGDLATDFPGDRRSAGWSVCFGSCPEGVISPRPYHYPLQWTPLKPSDSWWTWMKRH